MFGRRLALLCAAALAANSTLAAELYGARLQVALATPVGAYADLPLPSTVATPQAGEVRMRRIEVLAPGAKTFLIDAKGRHELADTGWRHYVADPSQPDSPRYGLSISPDGREALGVLFTTGGRFAIQGQWRNNALQLDAELTPREDADGNPIFFACELDAHRGLDLTAELGLPSREQAQAALDAAGVPKAVAAASRSATVAIDTDTELLTQKFAGNTTNATNYLNALFVGMNVIYERDIDVTLLRGDTTLRTASDPYSTTSASSTLDQLDEFGEEWFANQGAVNRAFAAQISGKSANANSSAGIAWLIGANNMCTQKGFTFGGCPDGTCTAGHYSISRVFKFAGSTAAHDVLVVAHEIGHNFGVNHTHCTSATTGTQPVSTGTIDQCFNGESSSGCYAGAAACPSAQTINGVPNVTGTLMSYCHITPAGCDAFEVFHPRNVTNLDAVADANVTSGCFTTGAGGTISIADRTLGEATSPMNFTLTRSNPAGTASVVASTAAGTATGGGTDYTNVSSQTVNFADGSATATLNVTINNDNIDEIDETFVVNLTTPSAGYTISDAQATGTITDDDTSAIAIDDPVAVSEGGSINFNVTLSTPNSRTVTVRADTSNGTAVAPGDFTARSNVTVTFPAGDVSEAFSVTTIDDNLDEPASENFSVNLSNASNAAIGDSAGSGSISDNEPTPTISIADAPAQAEDNINPLRYVVSLSGPSQSAITVRADTADGSATVANNDYQARSNVTVSFTSGDTSENFDVTKVTDLTFEADETVLVNLTNVSAGASILDGSASGTISNDDPGPLVSIADASLTEPASTTNMPFTISIPAVVGADVTVNFSTTPIDATAGSDYNGAGGSATITAGNLTGTVNIPILHDTTDEFDEQFIVTLAPTSTAQILDGVAIGTIIDNDSGGDPVFRNGFE
jgi:hypothetical protein